MSELREITFQLDTEASSEINRIYSVSVPIEFLKEWAQTQSMAGFRTGKVPLRLLKKDEFLKHHLSSVLNKIKEQENIDTVFASNYIIKKFDYEDDIQLSLSVEKTPELPIIDFKKIKVQTFSTIISDENIQVGIKNYSNYNSKPGVEISRKTQNGDFVDLDIEIEDIKSHNIEKNKQSIKLGSNTFIPLIENALIDKSVGFEFSHNASKDIIIRLKIKAIKESTPLSNDEIIEKLQLEDKSTEEFFRDRLSVEAKNFANNLILETIKKVILDSEFEVPLSSIQREYKKVLNQTLSNLNYVKELDLEEFIKNKLGISMKEFEGNLTNIAAAHAKIRFMYYTIAKNDNIRIEENEINYAIKSQVRFFNNNIEQTRKFYEENEEAKEEMLENILFSKISEKLIHQVKKLPPKEISLDELYKIKATDLQYTMDKDISNTSEDANKKVVSDEKDGHNNKKKPEKKSSESKKKSPSSQKE